MAHQLVEDRAAVGKLCGVHCGKGKTRVELEVVVKNREQESRQERVSTLALLS